jgi:hypothetical protein
MKTTDELTSRPVSVSEYAPFTDEDEHTPPPICDCANTGTAREHAAQTIIIL